MKKLKKSEIEEQIEHEFSKKFISQEKFAEEIEKYFKNNGYENYISAITDYCEENNIDLESVPKLISKQFKKKIEYQATKLNFLTVKPQAELPL